MKYIQAADVLYGLLLIDSVDKVKIKVNDFECNAETVSLGNWYIQKNINYLYMQKMNLKTFGMNIW